MMGCGDDCQSTEWIRDGQWVGPSIPCDLMDRRVELTCPTQRRMLLHALNSQANVVMGDFEDSTSPTWWNVIDGQVNVRDAAHRTLSVEEGMGGSPLQLNERTATLMVRPRGWHLNEDNIAVDGSFTTAEPSHSPPLHHSLFFPHFLLSALLSSPSSSTVAPLLPSALFSFGSALPYPLRWSTSVFSSFTTRERSLPSLHVHEHSP